MANGFPPSVPEPRFPSASRSNSSPASYPTATGSRDTVSPEISAGSPTHNPSDRSAERPLFTKRKRSNVPQKPEESVMSSAVLPIVRVAILADSRLTEIALPADLPLREILPAVERLVVPAVTDDATANGDASADPTTPT